MSDLTTFILQRIAEDEAVAREATRLPYEGLSWSDHVLSSERDTTPAMDAFVERHDPARVLAECAAKRRIVEGMQPFGPIDDINAEEIFALLALPYADHPDYRQEWTFT